MIEETIKIHDKFQFELKLNYKLEKDRKNAAYDVNAFIFLPKTLGINRYNYLKKNFYRNLRSYIRFKTPIFSLENMVNGERSPAAKLQQSYMAAVSHPSKISLDKFEYQIKMFNSIFKSALRDRALELIELPESDLKKVLPVFVAQVDRITGFYRGLLPAVISNIPDEVVSYFRFGDEYLSLILEKFYYALLEKCKKISRESLKTNRQLLLKSIDREIGHRKENQFDSIPTENSDNETVVFRFNILKKYIESVLFLDVSTKAEGQLIEQLFISLAAGLAMVFATTVAFIGQYKFGSYTISFFMVLVISYMFKDRIKELTRGFFKRKISKLLYDHSTKIYVGYKMQIGLCRESFNFLKHRFLPQEIFNLRNKYRTREFANKFAKETIIHYRKHIDLFPKHYNKIYHDYFIDGINDIMRFNVSPFLSKMDNPTKPIFIRDGEGYKKIFAKRVYHMNLIIKYQVLQSITYHRFRIILTRKGIKRIERVD